MEIAVIAIVGILVAMYYGLFAVVEVAADMGTREIKDLERDQKIKLMNKAKAREINKEDYDLATSNNAMLDGYDL